jgi:CRISPR/Cas system-associated exonuclease Cas4 (RecB family)
MTLSWKRRPLHAEEVDATVALPVDPPIDSELAMAQSLSGMYDTYLARMEDNHARAPGIHASEISKCFRMAVYTMRGEPKSQKDGDVSEKSYWKKVMDHGHWIHDMVQTHMRAMASHSNRRLTFEAELGLHPDLQPLAKQWNIHSSCDGLFTFYDKDPVTWNMQEVLRVGLEIKSSKSSEFVKLKAPKPEHVEQVTVYMAVLNIPYMWLLYYDKDTQNITPSSHPWLIKFDVGLWTKLEERFASWYRLLEAGQLPEPTPGNYCSFCPYRAMSCKPTKRTFALRRPATK